VNRWFESQLQVTPTGVTCWESRLLYKLRSLNSSSWLNKKYIFTYNMANYNFPFLANMHPLRIVWLKMQSKIDIF